MTEQRDLFGDGFECQDLLFDSFLSALVVIKLQCPATVTGSCRGWCGLALLATRLGCITSCRGWLGLVLLGCIVVVVVLLLLALFLLLWLLFALTVFLRFVVFLWLWLLFALTLLFFSASRGFVCLLSYGLIFRAF